VNKMTREQEVREWIQTETCPICKWKGGIDWVANGSDGWYCLNCGVKLDLVDFEKRIIGVWDSVKRIFIQNKECD